MKQQAIRVILLAILLCIQVFIVTAGGDKDSDTIIMNDSGDIIWKEDGGKGGKKGGDTIIMRERRRRDVLIPVIRANHEDIVVKR
uniref:Secreted protein n=1 Tax=Tetranychus urticae TaxID=32264 RepID=T1KHQ9_TETUR